MFKCPFCPNQIDEQKEIHPEHVTERRDHSEELSSWRQIRVVNDGATLLSVHVCPEHDLTKLGITLPKKAV